jgi:hypothetical protein
MSSEEKQIILRVAERYIRTGSASDEQVNVTCLPVDKTSHVERIGEDGRIILLDEYQLDGQVIWASYSTRSETVYLSLKSSPQKLT